MKSFLPGICIATSRSFVLFFILFFFNLIFQKAFAQNVGVGETAPTSRLDIKGSGNTGVSSSFQIKNSTNSVLMRVLDDGRVGINTANPQATFDFNSPTAFSGVISGPDQVYVAWREMDQWVGYFGSWSGTGTDADIGTVGANFSGKFHLVTQAQPRVTIIPSGEVGVGTQDPLYKMHVQGDLFVNTSLGGLKLGFPGDANKWNFASTNAGADLLLRSVTAANIENTRLYLAQNGNVSIGANDPAYKLDVDGRMRIRHNGFTSGLWLNRSDNVEGGFIGLYDNNTFGIYGAGNWKFLFDYSDNTVRLGTGTKATGYMLNVGGKAICTELRVATVASWPDYVFNESYKLKSLQELEDYIKQTKHLPGIPPASEIETNGMEVGDMQKRMMEKIEELTLYVIQLNKQNEQLAAEIAAIKKNNGNK